MPVSVAIPWMRRGQYRLVSPDGAVGRAEVLISAMEYAKIAQQHSEDLRKELCTRLVCCFTRWKLRVCVRVRVCVHVNECMKGVCT